MHYYSVIFSRENSFQVMEQIGSLGAVAIEDSQFLQNDFAKPYHHQLLSLRISLSLIEELESLLL